MNRRVALVTGSSIAAALGEVLGAVGLRAAAGDPVVTVEHPNRPAPIPVPPPREPINRILNRPHQGARECARRRRQMLRAKLKAEGS